MTVYAQSIGISILCLQCIWSSNEKLPTTALAYSPPVVHNYHVRRSQNNGERKCTGGSCSSSYSDFGNTPRGGPLHLDASPMEVQLSDIISVLDSPRNKEEDTISRSSPLKRITRTKKPRISTIKNGNGAVSSLQPLQPPNPKSVRRISSIKKPSSHIKIQENIHATTTRTSTIKTRRRPPNNRMHNDSIPSYRGASTRLTRDEENTLTTNMKTLKSVIRTRDEVALTKTSGQTAVDSVHSPIDPDTLPYLTEERRRSRLPYEFQPTEKEWAEACGISIIQLRRILIAGRNARTRLVDGNVGLVMSVAKRYFHELRRSVEGGGSNGVGSILTLQDMVQEGNLGLMEAAERFDSSKGARFGTYAMFWVRQRILRSIADNSRVIRLPAHVHTMLRNIRKTRADMEKEIGRAPSLPELAHELKMSPDKLQLYTASSRSVLSLEVPRSPGIGKSSGGDQDKRTLGDFIASDSPTPQEDAEFDALKSDIRAAIDGLGNDRERDVLIWRFGLEDGSPKTLGETAERLGITKDRVRMVEARALNKLRHPQRNHRLKDYVGEHHHRTAEEVGGSFYESFNPRSGFKSPDTAKKDTLSTYSPEQIWSV